jgi:hypothetical protein
VLGRFELGDTGIYYWNLDVIVSAFCTKSTLLTAPFYMEKLK